MGYFNCYNQLLLSDTQLFPVLPKQKDGRFIKKLREDFRLGRFAPRYDPSNIKVIREKEPVRDDVEMAALHEHFARYIDYNRGLLRYRNGSER